MFFNPYADSLYPAEPTFDVLDDCTRTDSPVPESESSHAEQTEASALDRRTFALGKPAYRDFTIKGPWFDAATLEAIETSLTEKFGACVVDNFRHLCTKQNRAILFGFVRGLDTRLEFQYEEWLAQSKVTISRQSAEITRITRQLQDLRVQTEEMIQTNSAQIKSLIETQSSAAESLDRAISEMRMLESNKERQTKSLDVTSLASKVILGCRRVLNFKTSVQVKYTILGKILTGQMNELTINNLLLLTTAQQINDFLNWYLSDLANSGRISDEEIASIRQSVSTGSDTKRSASVQSTAGTTQARRPNQKAPLHPALARVLQAQRETK
ncbi:hypothetical protein 3 [Shayang ascaridia galli virus 2]|uniref:Uncharacterized protein n=1 Tax=Shayang ascaridia galli virus 2 TaxID=1923460 RepID=A0A1L3KMR7_9RHAB|nr:hypothetical protein 3 [Shayang ascaridia galli virus 2]APG78677.1 hypothetical protein 3 [Shayang ascaridia galli virus 2]